MSELVTYPVTAILLLVAAGVIFRIFVRRDYLNKGRLGPLASFLQLLLFMLHALSAYVYMDIRFRNISTDNPLLIPGIICMILGLGFLLINMTGLGIGQSFGVSVTGLRQTGMYRYTRNPQIVFSSLLYIGGAMVWPAWGGLIWLGLLAVLLHVMVLTEEEHLRKEFGEEYERYCERTPRYIGLPRK